jgi:hypothetical protein
LTQAPVRKNVPTTLFALSVDRMEASAASLAPASKVRAITLLVVGRTVKSLPRRLAGCHVLAGVVLVGLVVVGAAVAVVALGFVVAVVGLGVVDVDLVVVVAAVVIGLAVVVVTCGELVATGDVAEADVVPGDNVAVSVADGDVGSDGPTDRVVDGVPVGVSVAPVLDPERPQAGTAAISKAAVRDSIVAFM